MVLRPGSEMEVEVCGEVWVAASNNGSQGEDEPFIRAESL